MPAMLENGIVLLYESNAWAGGPCHNNVKGLSIEPSSRDLEIIEIAKREVSCAHVGQFQPITKGPIVAVLWLSMLAVVAGFYMVGNKVTGLLGRKP